ncbi:MAG: hypothetical protein JO141_10905 [Bradyrhizobium sp.]|nr:hypothetical protein [Bradyrhizobium sp.]
MRPAPPISTAQGGSKQTEMIKTPREHFNTEVASTKLDGKERTLEQSGFGRSQHGHSADDIVAQTPLLSPAEIWRR